MLQQGGCLLSWRFNSYPLWLKVFSLSPPKLHVAPDSGFPWIRLAERLKLTHTVWRIHLQCKSWHSQATTKHTLFIWDLKLQTSLRRIISRVYIYTVIGIKIIVKSHPTGILSLKHNYSFIHIPFIPPSLSSNYSLSQCASSTLKGMTRSSYYNPVTVL